MENLLFNLDVQKIDEAIMSIATQKVVSVEPEAETSPTKMILGEARTSGDNG